MRILHHLWILSSPPLIGAGPLRESQNINSRSTSNSSCRCLPGDACWPSASAWAKLNDTVQGRLIATVPLASACHDPTYNETECAYLKEQWDLPEIHFESPSSIMLPLFQNTSCIPFTPESLPCTLGNYAVYSINVSSAADIAAGLKFAEENNIRLVIKNTGHDFLGRSTGRGSLGLWTHNLKSIDFLDYRSEGYTGPAIRMGAGVQGIDAYRAAHARGFRVIGGDCPSVGLAGGYTQGGGHSLLSSTYGLAADQTLEWELVTANGTHLVASPTQNADLYWALSGGGAGTYGVVVSLTSKIYRDGAVGGANLTFSSAGIAPDTYWAVIDYWHSLLPGWVDRGAYLVYVVTESTFYLQVLTLPDASRATISALLRPFHDRLAASNITYAGNITSFATYFEHYAFYIPPPYGPYTNNEVIGGRLIPRSLIETNNSALTSAVRRIVTTSSPAFTFNGLALNVNHSVAGTTPDTNAVLPGWRSAILSAIVQGPWDEAAAFAANVATENTLTDTVVPYLEAITPGAGTYMNEADVNLKTWKADFYGANYDALLAVKRRYDVNDLFYAPTAVGSDAWSVAGDGRLCRA
ncbi:hypothetical protein VTN02DRAFT_2487 [Thermoascus thermophilus]